MPLFLERDLLTLNHESKECSLYNWSCESWGREAGLTGVVASIRMGNIATISEDDR